MPPATRVRSFLLVFTALCLVALGLVLLAEFSSYQWAKRAVSVSQNFGRMVFAVVAVSFITVEGVPLMLAAWYRKEQIREAEDRGLKLALEADKQRREGETLEQAVARLKAEKENRH